MDWKALILIPVALCLMSAKGCQTLEGRAQDAAHAQGRASASIPPIDLPEACTALVERVTISDEPWVIHNWRWRVSADNRDRQSRDCASWAADYNAGLAGINKPKGQ